MNTLTGYDALGRPVKKSYSDATPGATYSYDGVGRYTGSSSGGTTNAITGFDAVGRPAASSQTTNGATYAFGYTYNLGGTLETERYPSGTLLRTCGDGAGRPVSVAKVDPNQPGGAPLRLYATVAGGTDPADGSTMLNGYSASGAVQRLALGNNVVESRLLNARQQPTAITAALWNGTAYQQLLQLRLGYGTDATRNNGDVQSASVWNVPGNVNVAHSFVYDGVGRLASAQEQLAGNGAVNWMQTYSYDAFGNRAVVGYVPSSGFTPQSLGAYANNRWNGTGVGYEGRGNQTALPSQTFSYDAENRVTATTQFNMPGIGYGYDGEGRRVTKTVGTAATVYVYDAQGELAAEYAGTGVVNGTLYLTGDQLGSTRLVTDGNGSARECLDYLPFGEEIAAGTFGRGGCYTGATYPVNPNPDAVAEKYTGKERDAETGLDNFIARYFSSAQGRFTSADDPLADQFANDPQSWNLYSYGRNNPLRYVDPTGRNCVNFDNGTQGDDGQGTACPGAQLNTSQSITVNAQQGNVFGAIGLNFFFALDNAANAFFSPLTGAIGVTPSYMRDTPTGSGLAANLGAGAAIAATVLTGPEGEAGQVAQIGRKLDYLLGLAKGNAHNVLRSQSMASALGKVGISDSAAMRQYLAGHLNQVLNDATNIVSREGGTEVRESLLMGPGGAVKLQSVWQGDKLITVVVKEGH